MTEHSADTVERMAKVLPDCEICGNPVDQSIAGRTVNSNGRHWHGVCYKAQEEIDRCRAGWEACAARLRAIADTPKEGE